MEISVPLDWVFVLVSETFLTFFALAADLFVTRAFWLVLSGVSVASFLVSLAVRNRV